MERIVLEVTNETARKWRQMDSRVKNRIVSKMDKLLKVMMDKEPDDLWPFLEKLRAKAETKGFNDKILEEILNDE